MTDAHRKHFAFGWSLHNALEYEDPVQARASLWPATCARHWHFGNGMPRSSREAASESPLVLHRPDPSTQGLRGAVGPVGVAEQGPAQENQVGLVGLKNGLGL